MFAQGETNENNPETIQNSRAVTLQFRVDPWEQPRETLRAVSMAGKHRCTGFLQDQLMKAVGKTIPLKKR